MPDHAHRPILTVRDLRRAQIVQAARGIVAAEGLEALTFGALEKRLGFTRGVITYHFVNKDEIVRAVLDAAIADIERAAIDAVKSAPSATAALTSTIRAMVTGFLGHSDAPQVLVSYWSRLRVDPALAELNADLYRRWRAFSTSLVERGIASGEFRRDVDAQTLGTLIVAQVIGIATQALFDPGAIDPGRAVAQASDALLALVRRGRGCIDP